MGVGGAQVMPQCVNTYNRCLDMLASAATRGSGGIARAAVGVAVPPSIAATAADLVLNPLLTIAGQLEVGTAYPSHR